MSGENAAMMTEISNNPKFPKIVFHPEFTERDTDEMWQRGYVGPVTIEGSDGSRYEVIFYNPTRLLQEIAFDFKKGNSFWTEPGLIVLPEITMPRIYPAVQHLWENGYFLRLKPIE